MKTSIALCTYNGAKYIEDQIYSIINQTCSVDEIVVCDDGSSDETFKIVGQMAQNAPVPIHIFSNEKNVGYFKNFIKAMSLCKGDIIFLSDQDDVWREDKVEKIVNWFDFHKEKDVIFTNARLIDKISELSGYETLWDRVGFGTRMQRYFDKGYGQEILTIANRVTGATMALRKSFIEGRDLTAYNICEHDYLISYLAACENRLGYMVDPLISYRIHNEQSIGIEDYELCRFSPLRACTREIRNICHLTDKAEKRLDFIRKREQWYEEPFCSAVHNIWNFMPRYKNIYGVWWYKFAAYDMYRCLRKSIKNCIRK